MSQENKLREKYENEDLKILKDKEINEFLKEERAKQKRQEIIERLEQKKKRK